MRRSVGIVSRNPHLNLCRRGSKNYDWYFNQLKRDTESSARKEHLKTVPLLPKLLDESKKRPRVYLDFTKEGLPLGRVTFELAHDLLPITSTNFVNLCSSKQGLTYQNSLIHRIGHNEYVQGGDVLLEQGEGTYSSYDTQMFDDEAFVVAHRAGVLSMASSGVDKNGSQFFVALKDLDHLNGRNVAFGCVVDGMDVLNEISKSLCINGKPVSDVVVSSCGVSQS